MGKKKKSSRTPSSSSLTTLGAATAKTQDTQHPPASQLTMEPVPAKGVSMTQVSTGRDSYESNGEARVYTHDLKQIKPDAVSTGTHQDPNVHDDKADEFVDAQADEKTLSDPQHQPFPQEMHSAQNHHDYHNHFHPVPVDLNDTVGTDQMLPFMLQKLLESASSYQDTLQGILQIQDVMLDFVIQQHEKNAESMSLSDMAVIKEILDAYDDFRKDLIAAAPSLRAFLKEHSVAVSVSRENSEAVLVQPGTLSPAKASVPSPVTVPILESTLEPVSKPQPRGIKATEAVSVEEPEPVVPSISAPELKEPVIQREKSEKAAAAAPPTPAAAAITKEEERPLPISVPTVSAKVEPPSPEKVPERTEEKKVQTDMDESDEESDHEVNADSHDESDSFGAPKRVLGWWSAQAAAETPVSLEKKPSMNNLVLGSTETKANPVATPSTTSVAPAVSSKESPAPLPATSKSQGLPGLLTGRIAAIFGASPAQSQTQSQTQAATPAPAALPSITSPVVPPKPVEAQAPIAKPEPKAKSVEPIIGPPALSPSSQVPLVNTVSELSRSTPIAIAPVPTTVKPQHQPIGQVAAAIKQSKSIGVQTIEPEPEPISSLPPLVPVVVQTPLVPIQPEDKAPKQNVYESSLAVQTLLDGTRTQLQNALEFYENARKEFDEQKNASKLMQTEMEGLQTKMETKEGRVKSLESQVELFETEHKALVAKSSFYAKNALAQQAELISREEQIKKLRADFLELQRQGEQLEIKLKTRTGSEESYQAALAAAEDRLEKLTSEVQQFTSFRNALLSQTPPPANLHASQSRASGRNHEITQSASSRTGFSHAALVQATEESKCMQWLKKNSTSVAGENRNVKLNPKEASRSNPKIAGGHSSPKVHDVALPSSSAGTDASQVSRITFNDLKRLSWRDMRRKNELFRLLRDPNLRSLWLSPNPEVQEDIEKLSKAMKAKAMSWKAHVVNVETLVENHFLLCIRNSPVGPVDLEKEPNQIPAWLEYYRSFCRWLLTNQTAEAARSVMTQVENNCRKINPIEWEVLYVGFFHILHTAKKERSKQLLERDNALPPDWHTQTWYCIQLKDLNLRDSVDILGTFFDHITKLNIKNLLVLCSAEDEQESHEIDVNAKLLRLLLREAQKRGIRVVSESRYHVLSIDHIWSRRALSGNEEFSALFIRRDEWKRLDNLCTDSYAVYEDSDGVQSYRKRIIPEARGGNHHLIPTLIDGKMVQFYSAYGNRYMQLELCNPDTVLRILSNAASEMNTSGVLGKMFCDVDLWIDRTGLQDFSLSEEGSAFFALIRSMMKLISDKAIVVSKFRDSAQYLASLNANVMRRTLNAESKSTTGAAPKPALSVSKRAHDSQDRIRDLAASAHTGEFSAPCFDIVISNASHNAWVQTCLTENAEFLLREIVKLSQQPASPCKQLMLIDSPFLDRDLTDKASQDVTASSVVRRYDEFVYARIGDLLENVDPRKLKVLFILQRLMPQPLALFEGLEFLMPSDLNPRVSETSNVLFADGYRSLLMDESKRMDDEESMIPVFDLSILIAGDDSNHESEANKTGSSGLQGDHAQGASVRVLKDLFALETKNKQSFAVSMLFSDGSSAFVVGNLGASKIEFDLDIADTLVRLHLPANLFCIRRIVSSSNDTVELNVSGQGIMVGLGPFDYCAFRLESTLAQLSAEEPEALYKVVSEASSFLPKIRLSDASLCMPTARPVVVEWKNSSKSGFVVVYGSFTKWKQGILLPPAMEMSGQSTNKSGPYSNLLYLPCGMHECKFVVDGVWTCSKEMQLKHTNLPPGDGMNNNMLYVDSFDSGDVLYNLDQHLASAWHNRMMEEIRYFNTVHKSEIASKSLLVPHLFTWVVNSPGLSTLPRATVGSSDESNVGPPRRVLLSGSFDGWKELYPLAYSSTGKYYWVVLHLPLGVYYYRFLIDGVWCISLRDQNETDQTGFCSNVLRL